MGLELIRSQVRDRGSPYAELGESCDAMFLGIEDSICRRGFSHWESGRPNRGIEGGLYGCTLPGIGLSARRVSPGGVWKYGDSTLHPWDLAQASQRALV